jgi:ubiquinone/menaquinone biosynthesis C-methylase UbiE
LAERDLEVDTLKELLAARRLASEGRAREGLETQMGVNFGPGLHAAIGRRVDRSAYDRYIGRWSRLFVPAVLAAAEVSAAHRILDVATGPGEAASMALSQIGPSGLVVGSDISVEMLYVAATRLADRRFRAVAADGQALPFADSTFDSLICQLGLMFFPDPARGLEEFRRVLRPRRRAAVCVISARERAPMWGVLAETLSRYLPDQREVLHLSFALADAGHLEWLMATAGFREISVTRHTHEGRFESFDDYWTPIEEGAGSLPQAYRALPEPSRRAVREEVQARLAKFESGGRLVMTVEMLIGAGRA